jgi:hypothetical protein
MPLLQGLVRELSQLLELTHALIISRLYHPDVEFHATGKSSASTSGAVGDSDTVVNPNSLALEWEYLHDHVLDPRLLGIAGGW